MPNSPDSAVQSAYPAFSRTQTDRYLFLYDTVFLVIQTMWWFLAGCCVVGTLSNDTSFGDCLRFLPSLALATWGIYLVMRGIGRLDDYRLRASNPVIFPILSVTSFSFGLVGVSYLLFFNRSLPFSISAIIVFLLTPPLAVPLTVLFFKVCVCDPQALLQAYKYHINTSNPENYDRQRATRETART
jgi:hypothetical protein